MSEAPKPRRRWFRYSLRTLFLVVTVVCVWLGWNVRKVREREEILKSVKSRAGYVCFQSHIELPSSFVSSKPSMPLGWRILGAKPVFQLALHQEEFTPEEHARLEALFPESYVRWWHPLEFKILAETERDAAIVNSRAVH